MICTPQFHTVLYYNVALVVVSLNCNSFPAYIRILNALVGLGEHSAARYLIKLLRGYRRFRKYSVKLSRKFRKLDKKGCKVDCLVDFVALVSRLIVAIPRFKSPNSSSFNESLKFAMHGRACYSANQFMIAVGFYGFALDYFISNHAPVLLSNRAACNLLVSKNSLYLLFT
jgi:hypothetical protein